MAPQRRRTHKQCLKVLINTVIPATLRPALTLAPRAVQVAQPQRSESVEVPAKKAKAVVAENDTPQPSHGGSKTAEPAASAAPFTGGFGGLASKGASGFAFGGTSTFGSGAFSSVAFGGTVFGGTPAASHASKASKDGGDRASPSVGSNAGSAAAAVLGGSVFASSADATNAADQANQVFATAGTSGAPPVGRTLPCAVLRCTPEAPSIRAPPSVFRQLVGRERGATQSSAWMTLQL